MGYSLLELRRGEAKELIEILIMVSTLTPILIFLSTQTAKLHFVFPFFWALCLSLDLYTTWRFYKQDQGRFRSAERNRAFGLLAEKFSFPVAAVAFITLVEIPFTAFLTFTLIPPVYTYLCGLNGKPLAYLSVGLAMTGFLHLQAAVRNQKIEMRQKDNRVNNNLLKSDSLPINPPFKA